MVRHGPGIPDGGRGDSTGGEMSQERLRDALGGLRPRVPESMADLEALRAEVRAVDQEVGALIRARRDAARMTVTEREDGRA